MAEFRQYRPDGIVVVLKGIDITGMIDGEFVTVERTKETWTKRKGAFGDGVRTQSHDRSGRATIKVLAQHPVNDALSALMIEDEQFGTGVGEFMMQDLNGTTLCHGDKAWLVKPPSAARADTDGEVEWLIDIDDLDVFIGGSLV